MSAQNDPGYAVGCRAEAPSQLLMTLLTSISHWALYFPLSESFSPSVSPPTQLIYFPRVAQHRNRCRVDPCCSFFFSSEFLTITPSLTRDKSNGANLSSLAVCSAGRSMGITVNTLYFSCSSRGLFAADAGARQLLSCGRDQGCALPQGDGPSITACSKWSESLSARSIRLPFFSVYQTVAFAVH